MTTGIHMWEKFCFQILISLALTSILVKGHNHSIDLNPQLMAPVENLTATQGQDVQFTCIVNSLGGYKVAWIEPESKKILAVHTHMVTLNQRMIVTHDGNNTWKLHIANVQLNDTGRYMCQVNTDPMQGQIGHFNVVDSSHVLNERKQNTGLLDECFRNNQPPSTLPSETASEAYNSVMQIS